MVKLNWGSERVWTEANNPFTIFLSDGLPLDVSMALVFHELFPLKPRVSITFFDTQQKLIKNK